MNDVKISHHREITSFGQQQDFPPVKSPGHHFTIAAMNKNFVLHHKLIS